jgi:hypothetical protein
MMGFSKNRRVFNASIEKDHAPFQNEKMTKKGTTLSA